MPDDYNPDIPSSRNIPAVAKDMDLGICKKKWKHAFGDRLVTTKHCSCQHDTHWGFPGRHMYSVFIHIRKPPPLSLFHPFWKKTRQAPTSSGAKAILPTPACFRTDAGPQNPLFHNKTRMVQIATVLAQLASVNPYRAKTASGTLVDPCIPSFVLYIDSIIIASPLLCLSLYKQTHIYI